MYLVFSQITRVGSQVSGDELRWGFYFGYIIFALSFINEKTKNNYIFFYF